MTSRLRTRLAHLFSREGFRGPALTLLSGSAFAAAVSYLALPLLTRLYTDEMFGVADYFVMLLGVLVNVAALRYEDALPIPERDEDAGGVLGLALVLTTVFCLALGVLAVSPQAHALLALLNAEAMAPWLWLLAPTLFCMRVTRLAELWLARRKAFRLVTAGDTANKLATTGARVGGGFAGAGTSGLIGGFAFAQLVSSVFYLAAAARGHGAALRGMFRRERFVPPLRRFSRFPLYAMPAGALYALVTRLPTLMLPWYFTFDVVGLFGRAFITLSVPLGYVGAAVARVFFAHAAEAHREGVLDRLTGTVHARLVMLGLFPALALIVAGPDLCAFVYGEEWRTAGVYARYIALWLLLAGVASPLTVLLDVLERQRTNLLLSLVMFAVQAAAIVAGGLTGDVGLTILLAGVAGAVVRALHVGVLLHLSRVRLRAALAPYARYAAFSLPGLLLAAAALPAGRPWLTTAAVALGGAVYAGGVLWRDRLLTTRGDA